MAQRGKLNIPEENLSVPLTTLKARQTGYRQLESSALC